MIFVNRFRRKIKYHAIKYPLQAALIDSKKTISTAAFCCEAINSPHLIPPLIFALHKRTIPMHK